MPTKFFQVPLNKCQIFCLKVSSWWGASRNDFFDFKLLPDTWSPRKKFLPAAGFLSCPHRFSSSVWITAKYSATRFHLGEELQEMTSLTLNYCLQTCSHLKKNSACGRLHIMLKQYFQYPFNNCQIFCIKVSSWWSASRNDFFDFELLPKGMLSSKKILPAAGFLLYWHSFSNNFWVTAKYFPWRYHLGVEHQEMTPSASFVEA